MKAYIDHRAATVDFDFRITVRIELEAGIWVVREDDDREYAVTSLQGLVDRDGQLHLAYPKGVAHRLNGGWGAREQILYRAVPLTGPVDGWWAAIPAAVRDLIEDSYLLARDATPETIGNKA